MKKIFFTPQGSEIKDLTSDDVIALAAKGDEECKRELLKQDINAAKNLDDIKAALLRWLQ